MRRGRSLRWMLVPLIVLVTMMAQTVTTTAARPDVSVTLATTAQRVDGGSAVQIAVTVSCKPKYEVLEALVTVSQDAAFGQGGIPLRCRNQPQTFVVRVESMSGGPFTPGSATASAYILLMPRGNGPTISGSDTQTVMVQ